MSKQFSYGNTVAVLSFMDPNLRIQLTLHCAELRCAEKAVALKCKSVKLEDGTTTINGTPYKAELNTLLFGNRLRPIEVKCLTTEGSVPSLPEDVKFQVKELDLGGNQLDRMEAILAPSTLDVLKIYHVRRGSGEHAHPIVRGARSVYVFQEHTDGLLEFLTLAPNKTFATDLVLPYEEFIPLIVSLKKREIGATITFETLDRYDTESVFEEIMENFVEYREISEQRIVISLSQDKDLEVTTGDDEGEYALELCKNRRGRRREYQFLKMEVVLAGRK